MSGQIEILEGDITALDVDVIVLGAALFWHRYPAKSTLCAGTMSAQRLYGMKRLKSIG